MLQRASLVGGLAWCLLQQISTETVSKRSDAYPVEALWSLTDAASLSGAHAHDAGVTGARYAVVVLEVELWQCVV